MTFECINLKLRRDTCHYYVYPPIVSNFYFIYYVQTDKCQKQNNFNSNKSSSFISLKLLNGFVTTKCLILKVYLKKKNYLPYILLLNCRNKIINVNVTIQEFPPFNFQTIFLQNFLISFCSSIRNEFPISGSPQSSLRKGSFCPTIC